MKRESGTRRGAGRQAVAGGGTAVTYLGLGEKEEKTVNDVPSSRGSRLEPGTRV